MAACCQKEQEVKFTIYTKQKNLILSLLSVNGEKLGRATYDLDIAIAIPRLEFIRKKFFIFRNQAEFFPIPQKLGTIYKLLLLFWTRSSTNTILQKRTKTVLHL